MILQARRKRGIRHGPFVLLTSRREHQALVGKDPKQTKRHEQRDRPQRQTIFALVETAWCFLKTFTRGVGSQIVCFTCFLLHKFPVWFHLGVFLKIFHPKIGALKKNGGWTQSINHSAKKIIPEYHLVHKIIHYLEVQDT